MTEQSGHVYKVPEPPEHQITWTALPPDKAVATIHCVEADITETRALETGKVVYHVCGGCKTSVELWARIRYSSPAPSKETHG